MSEFEFETLSVRAGVHRSQFNEHGRALGRVRDLDVFMEKAHQYMSTLPEEQQSGLQPLLQAWMGSREKARAEMVKYLDSAQYREFKKRFDHFVNTTGMGARQSEDGFPLPDRVREVAPTLIYARMAAVRAFDAVLERATLEQFHALRIEFKKLRYTLEFFPEVLGPEAEMVISEIKTMQDHLGDLNDAQVATQILREFLQEWDAQQSALPVAERTAPAPILDYLSVRYTERQNLEHSFRQAWDHFNQPTLRQNQAQAVSILPGIDINKSGTRKEDLLLTSLELNRVWILRKLLQPLNSIDAMEFLLDKMKGTKDNKDFLDSMSK